MNKNNNIETVEDLSSQMVILLDLLVKSMSEIELKADNSIKVSHSVSMPKAKFELNWIVSPDDDIDHRLSQNAGLIQAFIKKQRN